jgi:TonB-linked SusC/RagA family outer membrane protein
MKMYTKNIIIFLWSGFISVGVLFAQDAQLGNLKGEPGLTAPVSSAKFSISEDSLKLMSPDEDMRKVNLPFATSAKKFTAGDITVIYPEEQLKYDNVTTIIEALSGRVPGSYGSLNLRGLGNALIVVDGIPRPISEVSISEVEQITILKDANSAMLYGVQANRGVILITTKRGRQGKSKITTLVETGFNIPVSYPKYLGSADYMEWYNKALANDGLAGLYSQDLIDSTRKGNNLTRYPDADYLNSDFLKNYKPSSRVETAFSGGNKNVQFYTNLGWQRSGSLYNMGESSHTDRLNIRSNLNVRINDYISSHVDISTVFNLASSPNGDFFSDATTLKPNYYPLLIDTSLVGNKKLVNTARLVKGGYLLGGTSLYKNNVYGNFLLSGYNRQINTTGLFNFGLDFDLKFILKGLTLKTWTSLSFYNQLTESQTNTYAIYEPKWVSGSALQDSLALTKIGLDQFNGTQGISNSALSRDFAFYGMLDYNHKFGENHALSVTLLGYSDKYLVTGVLQSDKHAHLGTGINYTYNDKYMLNFNSAIVSSPKLSPDHRVAFSPSLALGWIISEEDFLKENSFINYLKLKISAGIINTDMSLAKYYSYEDILASSSSYAWGDVTTKTLPSTIFSNIANNNLFYEKRKELTLGTEAVLFNKSLWIDANYFRESKANLIVVSGLGNTYPSYLGGLNPAENYNEERYTGLELGITWKKSLNDFSFDLGTSMLFLNSEVVKRDEFYGEDYLYRAGKSTGAIFGLEALGLFKDDADIAGHATQSFGTVKPGDIKYKDQNGDGNVDTNDAIMIGNSLADFAGAFTLRMNYKNLTLFALSSVALGGQAQYNDSYYWVDGDVKYSETVLKYWTPETAATATYPRLSSKTNSNNFRTSTYWLENNSRITLDRVQLTYDFPTSLASKLFTKNFSCYIRASNLLTIAENKDKMELRIGSEPQYRYYSIGVKAMF